MLSILLLHPELVKNVPTSCSASERNVRLIIAKGMLHLTTNKFDAHQAWKKQLSYFFWSLEILWANLLVPVTQSNGYKHIEFAMWFRGACLFNLTFYIIQYTVYICRFFSRTFASNSKIQREHEGTVRLVVEEPSNQAPPFPILCSSAAKTQSWLHQHQTHRAYLSNNRKGETDAEYQQNASHMHLSLKIPVFPTQGSCQWREQHGNKQKKNEKDTLNKHP